MKIKIGFDELDKLADNISAVVNDKMLKDDMKNIIIWKREDKTFFGAYSGNIITLTEANVEVEGGEGEEFVQLRARNVTDILSSFKGLSKTVVAGIEFEIQENSAIMYVIEAPADEEDPHADDYHKTSTFTVIKPPVQQKVMKDVKEVNLEVIGQDVASADSLVYINALLPTVAKEVSESTYNIHFSDEHVFTLVGPYVAVMDNKLDSIFSNFKLQNSVASFVKSFIEGADTYKLDKNVVGNGLVILTLRVGNAVAMIKCPDMSRAFNMQNYITVPENGIVVDRAYFLDVLKRVKLNTEPTRIDITFNDDGTADMLLTSKTMKQIIPVEKAKGAGTYSFELRGEILSNVVFSHTNEFGKNIFFYLGEGANGNYEFVVKDNTDLWKTKMRGLSPARGGSFWK